jgi:hypothetical protein
MPQVGFERMIPVFEQVKTVHALDHAATVVGEVVTRETNYPYGTNTKNTNFPI